MDQRLANNKSMKVTEEGIGELIILKWEHFLRGLRLEAMSEKTDKVNYYKPVKKSWTTQYKIKQCRVSV